jgi:hypothetical protein
VRWLSSLLLVAGCATHTVGTEDNSLAGCCVISSTGQKVSQCSGQPSCYCQPELCSSGSACQADADCPVLGIPCTTCADGTTACPSDRCVSGQCVATLTQCPPPGCTSDAECAVPGACQQCPDGTTMCFKGMCLGGKCQTMPPMCPPPACVTDKDCPQPALGAACKQCPDGTADCPGAFCVNGQCQIQYPPCMMPPPMPCTTDAQCTAPIVCQQCADGTKACSKNFCDTITTAGGCQTIPPQCAPPACKIDSDCPSPAAPGPCQLCPNGKQSCPTGVCVNGQCKIADPPC